MDSNQYDHTDNNARKAHAERLLDSALAAARETTESDTTPFEEISYAVHLRRHQTDARPSWHELGRDIVRLRPRLSVALAAAAVFLLLATLVPFSYERTVGYEVVAALSAVDFSAAADEPGVQAGVADDSSSVRHRNAVRVRTKLAARNKGVIRAADYKVQYVQVSPVVTRVRTSFASQVTRDIFVENPDLEPVPDAALFEALIEGIVPDTMSSEALEKLIRTRLEERGVTGVEVFIARNEDPDMPGRRIAIKVQRGDKAAGTLTNSGAFLVGINPNDSTVTDAELEVSVRAELRDRGHDDATVRILHDEDGKRRVLIRYPKPPDDDD